MNRPNLASRHQPILSSPDWEDALLGDSAALNHETGKTAQTPTTHETKNQIPREWETMR
jgi:hypothetical protein